MLGITRFGISKMKESALMQASVSCCVDVYRGEWATVVSSICNFYFCHNNQLVYHCKSVIILVL